ncbi:eukaryotic translation initiation factor 3 subunit K isoform X2 [Babesia caballi]|uniref:Eukaryotic translation initiation factor 3 subunit K isoform X2 n=1 Tax=Babesia caballi TaxID=5871 RepID=A0AAV4LQY5_BABCB|nr:eukaryotic translation initiation factor 3 subunit K isoform X2 [Babesia caballi]
MVTGVPVLVVEHLLQEVEAHAALAPQPVRLQHEVVARALADRDCRQPRRIAAAVQLVGVDHGDDLARREQANVLERREEDLQVLAGAGIFEHEVDAVQNEERHGRVGGDVGEFLLQSICCRGRKQIAVGHAAHQVEHLALVELSCGGVEEGPQLQVMLANCAVGPRIVAFIAVGGSRGFAPRLGCGLLRRGGGLWPLGAGDAGLRGSPRPVAVLGRALPVARRATGERARAFHLCAKKITYAVVRKVLPIAAPSGYTPQGLKMSSSFSPFTCTNSLIFLACGLSHNAQSAYLAQSVLVLVAHALLEKVLVPPEVYHRASLVVHRAALLGGHNDALRGGVGRALLVYRLTDDVYDFLQTCCMVWRGGTHLVRQHLGDSVRHEHQEQIAVEVYRVHGDIRLRGDDAVRVLERVVANGPGGGEGAERFAVARAGDAAPRALRELDGTAVLLDDLALLDVVGLVVSGHRLREAPVTIGHAAQYGARISHVGGDQLQTAVHVGAVNEGHGGGGPVEEVVLLGHVAEVVVGHFKALGATLHQRAHFDGLDGKEVLLVAFGLQRTHGLAVDAQDVVFQVLRQILGTPAWTSTKVKTTRLTCTRNDRRTRR